MTGLENGDLFFKHNKIFEGWDAGVGLAAHGRNQSCCHPSTLSSSVLVLINVFGSQTQNGHTSTRPHGKGG